MKWLTLAPEQALGKILCHNIADAEGHKALHKGAWLGDSDLTTLRMLDIREVTVAVLEPGDVHEDSAAARLATAASGGGLVQNDASGGRVNLMAEADGLFKINLDMLREVNRIDGLTVATLRHDTVVAAGKMAATVKIIPFAVPEVDLARAEAICRAHEGMLLVRPIPSTRVGVILTGSDKSRDRVMRAFAPPIRARVEELGSEVRDIIYVPDQSKAIASAIELLQISGSGMVIIAGETSIMDLEDITPRGIVLAGGTIAHYGAPVEPGNLLLLAYLPSRAGAAPVPVLGAPGCIRSRDANVVDLILPRLLAGERLGRDDIVALADGGLML